MDEIPLPDDIPIPQDTQISTDVPSPFDVVAPQPEDNKSLQSMVSSEVHTNAVSENYDGVDDTIADMDIQANTPEARIEHENAAEVVYQSANNETDPGQSVVVQEGPDKTNTDIGVSVAGESTQEAYFDASQKQTVEGPIQDTVAPNPEYPLPPAEPADNSSQAEQAAVVDPVMMQNSQMQYSAANYMYQQHMADPSMMSNYSYMTGNYNDYMSMYNPMQQQYGNTYASYQNYNYAYPAMQQMYDGRNMASYAGTYPTQMLPANPPLPSAQAVSRQTNNNFNPPLPTKLSATVLPSKVLAKAAKNVDNQQPLQVKNDAAGKGKVVKSLPTIAKPTTDEEDSTNVETQDSSDVAAERADGESEKANEESTANNSSEDVNRYSPSLPMDEEESSNQTADAESTSQIRPPQKGWSVLGIAQAKKRLMAFSFSKQAAAAKKQAQEMAATTAGTKSKKENGEAGSDTGSHTSESTNVGSVFDDKHSKKKQKKIVQKEKARETIEEIEELKRTELMIGTNAMLYRQNLMNESNNRDKRSRSRRRSRSDSRIRSRRYSRSRSHERKSRRQPRKYRNKSRTPSHSRSASRSRSNSIQDKKPTVKTTDIKTWDDFRESGFQLDRYRRIKFKENGNFLESEVERRKKEEIKHRHRRSRSNERRSASIEKEVVEECRRRKINFLQQPMEIKQPLFATRDTNRDALHPRTNHDNMQEETLEYPSHMMQYTNTKPTLKYCENPKYATLHFITRTQLLEIVPDDISGLMKRFWDTLKPKKLKQKRQTKAASLDTDQMDLEESSTSSIQWWSKSPLNEGFLASEEEVEDDIEDSIARQSNSVIDEAGALDEAPAKTVERTRTRKSRFEEPTEGAHGVSVVVRSRWDSDYEDESPEKSASNRPSKADELSYPQLKNDSASRLSSESYPRTHEGPAFPPKKENDAENSAHANKIVKTHDSEEIYSKKHKEKKKRVDRNSDSKKSKNRFESPEPEMKTQNDETFPQKDVSDTIPGKDGDRKLVSEYEEFLKSVNFQPPTEDNDTPLYEGPKPPPRLTKKSDDDIIKVESAAVVETKVENESQNQSVSDDDEKEKMEVGEDDFDIDTFFLREKKLRKLSTRNAAEVQNNVPQIEAQEERTEVELEVKKEKTEKEREKKEKEKKKKASFKTKKRDVKEKKKREKKKKKKVSSDSSSSSSDSELEDSDSKRDSDSNSSTSTSSSSSTASSSSSDESSSDSASKKKRKRTKKMKKKEKKREKNVADKHKKKKRKKGKTSDSEDKKKKSKSEDGKKGKDKKARSDNFFELIEKSLAVSIKKSENEENASTKKSNKEKHKKRKKKHTKDKKEKPKDKSNQILPEMPEDVKTNFMEVANEQNRKSSDESNADKKKKKKSKKKRASVESPSEESSTWKRRKIDLTELEDNMAAQMNAFLGSSTAELESKSTQPESPEGKKKKKQKDSADVSNDEESTSRAKKTGEKDAENAVNAFFEESLDDWDESSTAAPVVANSMRDESKNEETDDSSKVKKKKKKQRKNEKRKSDKSKTSKCKTDKEKNKRKSSHKKKKTKKRKKHDDKDKNKEAGFKDLFDIQSIPLPDSDMLSVPSQPVDENIFSPKHAAEASDEEVTKNTPSKDDSFEEHQPLSTETTRDSFSHVENTSNQSAVNVSDRYSPTACDAEDDDVKSPQATNVLPTEIKLPLADTNVPSHLFSHYLPNIQTTFSTVVPSPVPAPSPVPPPTISTTPFSLADKLPPSKTLEVAGPTTPEDFPKDDDDKSTDANLQYKSFSIGKKEFRTKAALKFFSNNVFESLEEMERADLEEASEKPVSEGSQVEADRNIPKENDRKKVETRLSCERALEDRRERSVSKERSGKRERSNDRYRSSSRDRSRRKYRYERDDSYDNYRRRSRSRDRYKKYSYRDRYRRRSRSRNRRRSRDRDHYRHKRRSFSNDRDQDRRRTPPYENKNKDFDYDNMNGEREEQRFDEERRRKFNSDVINEITKSVREMSGNATIAGSNVDINALQENLVQLKETLQNLNNQGVPLDALHNVLLVLENSNISSRAYPLQADEAVANFQMIMSVCQAIHSNLPVTPTSEKNSMRSPQDPANMNMTLKMKKGLADSTNVGYKKSGNRFDTRSREISPKPLSLDERLELELGVKRNAVPPVMPPQGALNVNPDSYYPIPMFVGRPNFPAHMAIPNYPPPMINCTPERAYYRAPAGALNWSNITKIPPPMIMQQIPPPHVQQPPPSDQAAQKKKAAYRPPDGAGSKVHAIQVGNVLQIVPTELQPPGSSQSKVTVVSSNPSIPSSQPVNSLPISTAASTTGFSALLSAHLPSFATAPAVSGAKTNAGTSLNETPKKEQKLVPNDPRQKSKDKLSAPAPAAVISETEMKKLMRLAKEKRKEEKALQNMLKARGIRKSPATPTSDENNQLDEMSMDEHEAHHTTVHIKPSPEQGILISPGFKEKSTPVTALGRSIIGSTRKMVSFVDGVRPGSANDSPPARSRRQSPPPSSPSSAPKKKHKVRVKIIRPDDSDDDDDAPPPPPPGPPPPELYPPTLGALGVLPPGFILPKL